MRYDVAVVGLGILGSACVAELSAAGVAVLGIERSPPGTVRGASGGGTKLVKVFHPDRPALSRVADLAYARWRELTENSKESPLRTVGGVYLGRRDDTTWLERIQAGSRRIPALRRISHAEALRLADWLDCPADVVAAYEETAAVLDARRSIELLRDQALARGATLRFGVGASLDRPDRHSRGRPVSLRLGQDEAIADRVVFCLGPWTPSLPFPHGIPGLWVERAVVHWTQALGTRVEHSPFVASFLDPRPFLAAPTADGSRLKFGCFGTGEAVDAIKSGAVLPHEAEADREMLRRIAPDLAGSTITSKRCFYTHTRESRFFHSMVNSRMSVAVACSGMGFKFAPLVAREISDHVLRRQEKAQNTLLATLRG